MSNLYTSADHFVLLPVIMLALFGCAALLFEFVLKAADRRWLTWLSLAGVGFTAVALARQQMFVLEAGPELALRGSLLLDQRALFFNWLFLISAAVTILMSYRVLELRTAQGGEFYGLVLLACAGMFLVAGGQDLIVLLLGLEIVSICFYALVAFYRNEAESTEAALKYLLLGSFSSALLAYGMSLLFGLAGSSRLGIIAANLKDGAASGPWLTISVAALLAGVLFKVGAAPFHVWAPDAYQGAPTPVTGFLSVASRAASFALLLRLFPEALISQADNWRPALAIMAVLSLIVGNFAALTQQNIKRLLAYGSIAHTGYLLLALSVDHPLGETGFLAYLAVYVLMTLTGFLTLSAAASAGFSADTLEQASGLAQRNPALGWLLVLSLISLTGIPPTAGFIGKYLVFQALLESQMYALAVIAAIYVAVAMFYYLRIARAILFRPTHPDLALAADSAGLRLAAICTGLATLVLGIYPQPLLEWARLAVIR